MYTSQGISPNKSECKSGEKRGMSRSKSYKSRRKLGSKSIVSWGGKSEGG